MPGPALLVFLYIGVVSFGGGLAILPEMHRQFVDAHHWLTAEEFADGYALGQLAPGPNMLSVVFYGFKVAGIAGGLLAPVASFGPGIAICAALGRAWATLESHPWVAWIRRGLVPVGVGLMAAGVFVLARSSLRGWGGVAITAVVLFGVQRKLVSNAVAVLLAGAAGALFHL